MERFYARAGKQVSMLWVDHVEIDTISYGNFVKAGQAHGDDGRTSSSRPGWPSPDEG